MNHLDGGRPSRRQTLNISPVGFLRSIPVHVSAFLSVFFVFFFFPSALYSRSLGLLVSQQQHSPQKGRAGLKMTEVKSEPWMNDR